MSQRSNFAAGHTASNGPASTTRRLAVLVLGTALTTVLGTAGMAGAAETPRPKVTVKKVTVRTEKPRPTTTTKPAKPKNEPPKPKNESPKPASVLGDGPVVTPPAAPPVTDAPVVTQPPVVTEPPNSEPPKTEPPKTEPPKTEPPKSEPPKTEAPSTEPPKTDAPKTETRTASTITLSCGRADGSVRCSWSLASTAGVTSFMLLRGDGSARGRAFGPFPATATQGVDSQPVAGATYSYVVIALGSAGTPIAHSDGVVVTIG